MSDIKIDIQIGKRLEVVREFYFENSNKAMAEGLGIDESQFSRILRGKAGFKLEAMVDLSSRFGVSLQWLITGEGGILKEKSGDRKAPDVGLLTQLRDQLNSFTVNFDKLFAPQLEPEAKNKDQEPVFVDLIQGRNQKADKR